jgi:hypothetical protein
MCEDRGWSKFADFDQLQPDESESLSRGIATEPAAVEPGADDALE